MPVPGVFLFRPAGDRRRRGNCRAVVLFLLLALLLVFPDGGAQAQTAPSGGAPTSLLPAAKPAVPPPAVAPVAPPAAPAPPPAAATHPAPAAAAALSVRGAEHGDYFRLVFDWPGAVGVTVQKQGSQATLTFNQPARIDMLGIQASLPADVSILSADSSGKSSVVALSLPEKARVRQFASGNRIVVDIVRSADTPGPPEGGKPPPPNAPAADSDIVLPSVKPKPPEPPPAVPAQAAAAALNTGGAPDSKAVDKTGGKPADKAVDQKTAAPAPAPPAAPAAAPPPVPALPAAAAAPAPLAPAADPPAKPGSKSAARPDGKADKPEKPGKTGKGDDSKPAPDNSFYSLSVSWDRPVAMALFWRSGSWWMVFDRKQPVDTSLLRRLGGEAVLAVEEVPHRDATVVRMVLAPEMTPSVRKDGLLWVIDVGRQKEEPKTRITVNVPVDLPTGKGVTLDALDTSSLIKLTDPDSGEMLQVVPLLAIGAGVAPGRVLAEVHILPTIQGIALLPLADDLDIATTRKGVSIGRSGGNMRLSSPESQQLTAADGEAGGRGLFDVLHWLRGGDKRFGQERQLVESGLLTMGGQPLPLRAAAHLQAARFFFANGFAPESLGYLGMAATEDPAIAATPGFIALRGANNLLLERWDLALPDLDHPALEQDPEVQIWRAAAHVGAAVDQEQQAEWNGRLALGLPLIKDYPRKLKWPLASWMAIAAIAAHDERSAQKAVEAVDKLALSAYDKGRLLYLRGSMLEMIGQTDAALAAYDQAEAGDNRQFRAMAGLASVNLRLRQKKMSPKRAMSRLDGLRFAWRNENYEFRLLQRLADLQFEAGLFPDSLRSLQALILNYPTNRHLPEVKKAQSDAFEKLYLDGAADAMPPVTAIALYDEFRALTPDGEKGDQMIRKLADRLASVDLLDSAADLLAQQVTTRLQGVEKARVGAQLALLKLLSNKPADAQAALQNSLSPDLPPDLSGQRLQLMARALADQNRVPDAIALLNSDLSPDNGLLKAEIHWRKQMWSDAASDFEALIPRPERGTTLDDSSARLVLSWATALTLSNDERGLAALRRNYAPAMEKTPLKGGFTLLTSALDREVPNMAAITAKVKEAEGFMTFMTSSKAKMQQGGLSKMN